MPAKQRRSGSRSVHFASKKHTKGPDPEHDLPAKKVRAKKSKQYHYTLRPSADQVKVFDKIQKLMGEKSMTKAIYKLCQEYLEAQSTIEYLRGELRKSSDEVNRFYTILDSLAVINKHLSGGKKIK